MSKLSWTHIALTSHIVMHDKSHLCVPKKKPFDFNPMILSALMMEKRMTQRNGKTNMVSNVLNASNNHIPGEKIHYSLTRQGPSRHTSIKTTNQMYLIFIGIKKSWQKKCQNSKVLQRNKSERPKCVIYNSEQCTPNKCWKIYFEKCNGRQSS